MADLNQPQEPEQGQPEAQNRREGQGNSPFGAKDREKRLFRILPLSRAENVSYEVVLNETQQGNVESQHINRKFISGGVEITPTTVCGRCEICEEVNLGSAFINCGVCGKRVCPKCRRNFLRKGYCKWRCILIALCTWSIKLLFRIIAQVILTIAKVILKIIIIPLKDILRG